MSSPPAKKHSNTSFLLLGGEEQFVGEADMVLAEVSLLFKELEPKPPRYPPPTLKSHGSHTNASMTLSDPLRYVSEGRTRETCGLRLNSSATIVPLSLE